jgi:hypothetical protein
MRPVSVAKTKRLTNYLSWNEKDHLVLIMQRSLPLLIFIRQRRITADVELLGLESSVSSAVTCAGTSVSVARTGRQC